MSPCAPRPAAGAAQFEGKRGSLTDSGPASRHGRGGMKGKKEVVDILNEALKHELGAVNQYWLHYRMLDNWGFTKLAKKERKESIEEMQHADKLVVRILFLEGLPNLQYIAPLMIGQTLKEVLECDLKGEYNARDLYTRARGICRTHEDLVSMQLFEDLLKDEESHIDFLETQLDLMDKIGVQNYGQLQADAADDVEGN
jgi:bacterioferritin